MSARSLSLLLLAASACAPAEDASPVFSNGSADELLLAEQLALDALDDPAGPAAAKGVQSVRVLRSQVDPVHMAHVKVQQELDGVPVFGAQAIVHLDRFGRLHGTTDDLVGDLAVDTTPLVDDLDATERAVGAVGGWATLTDDTMADLWVLRHQGRDHLAWRVQIRQLAGDAHDALPVVFVDAHTGDILWTYDNLQTASGSTNFYGTVSIDTSTPGDGSYYLEDTTDLLGTYSWGNTTSSLYYVTDADDVWTDANAVEAHYVAQAAYNYFLNEHGRDGIDGAGGPAAISSHGYGFITSTVNYSRNYVNAYWDPTNLMMVYGDGDGYYSNSLTTLDVGGHELTHGVTQYEANLTYSGESGGINESMSDVFGALVEASVLGESADTWLIGEDTWTPSVAGDALRYMDYPTDDGYSYDYYVSTIGNADVHDSSGVANLAFYLLVNGGAHPRLGGTAVTGIGSAAAADIWYLALTSYMTASTTFSGARTATLSAASALYGATSTQYTSVDAAWAAVGVAAAPACTTSNYSGSISRRRSYAYVPSSSGVASSAASQSVSMTGPASSDFDLYLQKKSGNSWSTVASDTGSSTSKSLSYSGSSGTYRVRLYSASGTGNYTVAWCK